ncbi:hypothetical protein A5819_002059 [Enterococcus sp. 7E2_DIV0204]|uniref:AraC family transcriptional regulator n=1 Tax=unclassified Enterococcus TaxID=2608891 RepID=UPI000B65FB0A|nr:MULTISPECIES: AraC family transcriptional regulator [unclassified Enterococcus]OTN89561.1 hypothetical protein A5819_002059 [Enterococcus sp. 7E2_DIV0204]OTP52017.1 hypothetical protein A5884_001218 [Enterococcus sp. 7D2_DIV0200]
MVGKQRNYRDIFVKEQFFSDFYFFNIGHELCESRHHHGPTMREEHVVHYIVSGQGAYEVNGIKYRLEAGNFFIIKPNEMTFYQADAKDPWEYYWFGFSGAMVKELLYSNGIGSSDYVGKVEQTQGVKKLFEEIMTSNMFDDREKLINQARFLTLFSGFKLQEKTIHSSILESRKQKYSESFLLYVKNNYYREELSISEIGHSMGLNSSYLSQVIKGEIGFSPMGYLKEFRLQKASILMETTNLPITEVALAVGYKSSQTFSRAFKNQFGCSPSNFSGRRR